MCSIGVRRTLCSAISLISRRDLGFGTIVWVRHMEHAAARSSLAPPSNTLQRDSDVDRQSDSPLHRLTTERSLPGFAPAEMVAPGQQPQQGVCGFLGQGGSLPMQGQFMGSSGQYDASYQTQHAYSPPGMVSPQHTDLPPPRGRQISPNGQHWGGGTNWGGARMRGMRIRRKRLRAVRPVIPFGISSSRSLRLGLPAELLRNADARGGSTRACCRGCWITKITAATLRPARDRGDARTDRADEAARRR